MACHIQYTGFKWEVISELRHRNENERKIYENLINLTNNLYESLDFYKKENFRLRFRIEQNVDQPNNLVSVSPKPFDKSSVDKKMFLLQGEFAELHKQKENFALQVINLQMTLDEKKKELAIKNAEVLALEEALNNSELLYKRLQQKLSEAEHNLQFIKDEHDALRITYYSVEEKNLKLEKENKDLIACLRELKANNVDHLNSGTEMMQRKKQAKLQKELDAAARKPVILEDGRVKIEVSLDTVLSRNVQYKFNAHESEVNAVKFFKKAWTNTANVFATAGGDCRVKVWDLVLGHPCLKTPAGKSKSSVFSIAFDTKETLLLAASYQDCCIWTLNDMKIKHTLTGHKGKVMSAKFWGNNCQVVSGSHDRTLKIWDLQHRLCTRTIFVGSSANDVVTTGNTIISGHFDKKIRFGDTRSESSTNEILLQGRITSLDLSWDGYSLLSCVRDDTLNLIDFRMNNVVRTFSDDGFFVGCDWTRAKFSPDGQFCICGSQDGSIHIWKVSCGSVEKVLKEHSATVIACAWSWCGNFLLSCDKNKKVILWKEFVNF